MARPTFAILRIDPLLLWLVATVGVVLLWPLRGRTARFARQAATLATIPPLPRNEADIHRAAGAIGLPIDAICMPGVVANMALLDRHVGLLLGRDESAAP